MTAIPDRATNLRTWRSLSPKMKAAMDAAANAPLMRKSNGWSHRGLITGFQPHTVVALERRGLIKIDWNSHTARITPLGKAVFESIGEPYKLEDLA